MKSLLNGKLGLGWTYWGGVVGLGLILEVSLRYITYLYLTTSDDAALERLDLIQISLVAVGSVLAGLLFRAMIIAGFDNRRPGFWGWIGIVISGLRTLFLTFTTVSLLFPSLAVPLALVKIELRELNKQLPQDMGDGLTLHKTSLKGAEMWYFSGSIIRWKPVKGFISKTALTSTLKLRRTSVQTCTATF